jgi:hypothetical protein
MVETDEKSFLLDSVTAPKPQYLQLTAVNNTPLLTFLNTYKNAIYIYNYDLTNLVRIINFSRTGANGIPHIMGYDIKSLDSIYVYDLKRQQLVLASADHKIIKRTSLINNVDQTGGKWAFSYPQRYPTTAAPMMETAGGIVFPGQYMWALPDSLLHKFNFNSLIDYAGEHVRFMAKYPAALYDPHFGWDDPIYSTVYCDLAATPNTLVYSFPISHDLYIGDLNGKEMKGVYGGSNQAGTISTSVIKIENSNDTRSKMRNNIIENDLYGGIKYDKYRKLYYRFIRRGIPGDKHSSDWKMKPLAIIIMDSNFHYLGETTIGTLHEWNWENSFVTQKGLNVEYLPSNNDESKLIFKIFTPKRIGNEKQG